MPCRKRYAREGRGVRGDLPAKMRTKPTASYRGNAGRTRSRSRRKSVSKAVEFEFEFDFDDARSVRTSKQPVASPDPLPEASRAGQLAEEGGVLTGAQVEGRADAAAGPGALQLGFGLIQV